MAISSDKIILKIRPIADLRPHEQTIGRLSKELSGVLQREGVQRDPVVVDTVTGTILDGTHRVEALGDLGAKSVLAWLVNYQDPEIRLFRWFRLVNKPGAETVEGVVSALRLQILDSIENVDFEKVPPSGLKVTYRGRTFGRKTAGLEDEIETVRGFDRLMAEKGLRTEFMDEASATASHRQGEDLILSPPRISKEEVLRAGSERRLFPPKSTLHVFPFRPLGFNYPIEELRRGVDVLDRVIGTRRPRLLAPSSSHRGRGYREQVLVFE